MNTKRKRKTNVTTKLIYVRYGQTRLHPVIDIHVGSSKSQFSKPNSVTKTCISSHILPDVMITYIDIDKNIVFPSYSMKE